MMAHLIPGNAAARVADILGGSTILRARVRSWRDLDQLVRAGLPKRSLQLVARRAVAAGVPSSALVYAIVPSATFKRRTRLSPDESARTERLARVIALAEAVWVDAEAAREFLNRPHPLLEHETPLAVAHTELGARRVENILYAIEHGLPL
jgi:putative toxin-antitoxin system antitoxin component (TIGR02293 family)